LNSVQHPPRDGLSIGWHRSRAEHRIQGHPDQENANDQDRNPKGNLQHPSGEPSALVLQVFLLVLDYPNPSFLRIGTHGVVQIQRAVGSLSFSGKLIGNDR
jgi:hypothetical protein